MNKITRKQNSLYCINIIKSISPSFTLDPKVFNESIKNYHIHYDKYIKKKLGKAKRENE